MALSKNDREDTRSKELEVVEERLKAGDVGGAFEEANKLLNQDFADHKALYLIGSACMKTERFGLAYNIFKLIAALYPNNSGAWNNAGNCHQETWNLDDAEKCFRKALQVDPHNAAAMQNIALVYVNRCQPQEALKWAARAEKVEAATLENIDNKALAWLMLRQWKDGWAAYRQTAGLHKTRGLRSFRSPEEPSWNGERGHVVVYGTQGLGDEIAFASCIPDAAKVAEISLICDPRLEGLFARSFPNVHVQGSRYEESIQLPNPEVDYSIPLDCLPQLFRNADAEFPGTPYLKADPERRIQWRGLFDTLRRPVIGVAWTGGLDSTGKKKRSLTLEELEPIFRAIDATWVSLEHRNRADEIQKFGQRTGIQIRQWPRATQGIAGQFNIERLPRETAQRLCDYDDAAALVVELDLVISVTTAVVHLSGALGKECFCLAPSKPRWFYGLEGDLPWYRSVRMFRQKEEWPIGDIVRLLKLRYGERRNDVQP